MSAAGGGSSCSPPVHLPFLSVAHLPCLIDRTGVHPSFLCPRGMTWWNFKTYLGPSR